MEDSCMVSQWFLFGYLMFSYVFLWISRAFLLVLHMYSYVFHGFHMYYVVFLCSTFVLLSLYIFISFGFPM